MAADHFLDFCEVCIEGGWASFLFILSLLGFLVGFLAKGSVESTHKVPTSHYHTKHCHAAVVSLGGLSC